MSANHNPEQQQCMNNLLFFIITKNIKVDGATSLLFWNLYSVKWNKTINVAKTYWKKRDN